MDGLVPDEPPPSNEELRSSSPIALPPQMGTFPITLFEPGARIRDLVPAIPARQRDLRTASHVVRRAFPHILGRLFLRRLGCLNSFSGKSFYKILGVGQVTFRGRKINTR